MNKQIGIAIQFEPYMPFGDVIIPPHAICRLLDYGRRYKAGGRLKSSNQSYQPRQCNALEWVGSYYVLVGFPPLNVDVPIAFPQENLENAPRNSDSLGRPNRCNVGAKWCDNDVMPRGINVLYSLHNGLSFARTPTILDSLD